MRSIFGTVLVALTILAFAPRSAWSWTNVSFGFGVHASWQCGGFGCGGGPDCFAGYGGSSLYPLGYPAGPHALRIHLRHAQVGFETAAPLFYDPSINTYGGFTGYSGFTGYPAPCSSVLGGYWPGCGPYPGP